jgi:hypothetical protein
MGGMAENLKEKGALMSRDTTTKDRLKTDASSSIAAHNCCCSCKTEPTSIAY